MSVPANSSNPVTPDQSARITLAPTPTSSSLRDLLNEEDKEVTKLAGKPTDIIAAVIASATGTDQDAPDDLSSVGCNCFASPCLCPQEEFPQLVPANGPKFWRDKFAGGRIDLNLSRTPSPRLVPNEPPLPQAGPSAPPPSPPHPPSPRTTLNHHMLINELDKKHHDERMKDLDESHLMFINELDKKHSHERMKRNDERMKNYRQQAAEDKAQFEEDLLLRDAADWSWTGLDLLPDDDDDDDNSGLGGKRIPALTARDKGKERERGATPVVTSSAARPPPVAATTIPSRLFAGLKPPVGWESGTRDLPQPPQSAREQLAAASSALAAALDAPANSAIPVSHIARHGCLEITLNLRTSLSPRI